MRSGSWVSHKCEVLLSPSYFLPTIGGNKAELLLTALYSLWGNPEHLKYLATSLQEEHPDNAHVLVAESNSGNSTYDGIELGGERVTREIEDTLEELAKQGQTIRKISIIGYSLGGLIARYAIGLLHHKRWFDKLELHNVRDAPSGCTDAAPWSRQSGMECYWGEDSVDFWHAAVHHRLLPRYRPSALSCPSRS